MTTIASIDLDSTTAFRRQRTERLLDLIHSADAEIAGALADRELTAPFVEAAAHQLVHSVRGRSASEVSEIVTQRWSRMRAIIDSIDAGIAVMHTPLVHGKAVPSVFDDGMATRVPSQITDAIRAARKSLDDTEYGTIFSSSVGIIVGLKPIALGDLATSYTNPSVSGSVYCDIIHAIPALVARDLVHEATHCWFNDYLTATGLTLDQSTPRFYSPWKKAERPEFGFAHAVISFSIVCLYLESEICRCSDLDEHTARVLRVLLDSERERLTSVLDGVAALAAEKPGLEFLNRLAREASSR